MSPSAKQNPHPLQAGLIGLGAIAGAYLETYRGDRRVELAALADTNEMLLRETAKRYEVPKTYTDWRRLVEDEPLDVVIVATPHFLHQPMVLAALEAGKHVICEKPLAMNTTEAQAMIDAADRAGRQLLVGLNMRTVGGFRSIERLIRSGRLGKIFLARIAYLGHEVERMLDPMNWKCSLDKAGGGILLDGGYHVIDVMNMLFGKVERVQGRCRQFVIDNPAKGEDNALVTLEYESGVLAEVTASFTIKLEESKQHPTLGLRLEVYGSEGSAWVESRMPGGWRGRLIAEDTEQPLELESFQPDNIQRHFIDVLAEGAEPLVTAHDALAVQGIVDEVYAQNRGNA